MCSAVSVQRIEEFLAQSDMPHAAAQQNVRNSNLRLAVIASLFIKQLQYYMLVFKPNLVKAIANKEARYFYRFCIIVLKKTGQVFNELLVK